MFCQLWLEYYISFAAHLVIEQLQKLVTSCNIYWSFESRWELNTGLGFPA